MFGIKNMTLLLGVLVLTGCATSNSPTPARANIVAVQKTASHGGVTYIYKSTTGVSG